MIFFLLEQRTYFYLFIKKIFIYWLHPVLAVAGEVFTVVHSAVCFSCSLAGGILAPQPGIKPVCPACKVDS